MRTIRRGLQDIVSIMKAGQPRQVHTLDEIFNELARLNWEKVRLDKEKINCQKRIDQLEARTRQVEGRLRQIEKIEKSLQEKVQLQMTTKIKIDSESQETRQDDKQSDTEKEHSELIINY
jgi:chromosome segregation ATPase